MLAVIIPEVTIAIWYSENTLHLVKYCVKELSQKSNYNKKELSQKIQIIIEKTKTNLLMWRIRNAALLDTPFCTLVLKLEHK